MGSKQSRISRVGWKPPLQAAGRRSPDAEQGALPLRLSPISLRRRVCSAPPSKTLVRSSELNEAASRSLRRSGFMATASPVHSDANRTNRLKDSRRASGRVRATSFGPAHSVASLGSGKGFPSHPSAQSKTRSRSRGTSEVGVAKSSLARLASGGSHGIGWNGDTGLTNRKGRKIDGEKVLWVFVQIFPMSQLKKVLVGG